MNEESQKSKSQSAAALPGATQQPNSQSAAAAPVATQQLNTFPEYRQIVDWTRGEISWVRAAYVWLISLVGVVIVSGTFFSYKSINEFKAEIIREGEKQKNSLSQETELLSAKLQSQLEEKAKVLAARVETRIDDEFKKENIVALVQKKAEERIDAIADRLISEHIQQLIAPKLASMEDSVGEMKAELKNSSETMANTKIVSDFVMTVLSAQNDNRKAFDKLLEWAKNTSFVLSKEADAAAYRIFIDDAVDSQSRIPSQYPWPADLDKTKLSADDYRQIYVRIPPQFKVMLVKDLWENTNLVENVRFSFLEDLVKNAESLQSAIYATMYLSEKENIAFPAMNMFQTLLDRLASKQGASMKGSGVSP